MGGGKRTAGWAVIALAAVLLLGPYLLPLSGQAGIDAVELAPADARFVRIDGERVHIRVDGPPAGPPVVLIHGLAGSTFTWRLTVPELAAAGFRTLALDLRGYGLSDKSFDADHSVAGQAGLVARVMDATGIGQATLIGHSLGGAVALHVALTRPELVARLVLVSPWVPSTEPALWPTEILNVAPLARWGRHAVRALVTPGRVAAVLGTLYRQPDEIAQAVAAGHLVPTAVLGWDEAVLAVIRDAGRSQLPGQLADVSAPTLIVWGGQDGWLSPARAPSLRDAITDARLVLIEDAGHLPFEEQPERFVAEILPFLAAGE